MWLLLAGAFAAAIVAPKLKSVLPRAAPLVLASVPAVLCAWLITRIPVIAAGGALVWSTPWVDSLGLTFALRMDGLALILCLLVTGIGALVLVYASGYLDAGAREGGLYSTLLAFMGAMLGLVLADNLLLLFLFWEVTSVASFLLIGFDRERESARNAARKALLVTAFGGICLLGGFLLLGEIAGTFGIARLADAVRSHDGGLLHVAVAFILIGAFTKSAQVPFHFWLPRAMEAPAPVSAYLHSSTMVVAGVYLLARLFPALSHDPLWTPGLVVIGSTSLVVGGVMAYGQVLLKKQLAYSTVSALGAMVLLLGVGTRLSIKAAIVFLVVHAIYKSAFFLTVGSFTRATGVTDVEKLGGLARTVPVVALAGALAALSMAGIPPAVGFVAKETIFGGLLFGGRAGYLAAGLVVVPLACLVAVALLVGFRPYFPAEPGSTPKGAVERMPNLAMRIPPMTLALLGIALGVAPGIWGHALVEPAVGSVLGIPVQLELELWSGVNLPFLLDAVAVGLGGLGFAYRRPLRRALGSVRAWPSFRPELGYERAIRGLQQIAAFQTRRLWGGTLGNHVGVVALILVVAAGPVLLRSLEGDVSWPGPSPDLVDALLVVLVLGGGVGMVLLRSTAALIASLGLVGYGVTLIFVRFGAPDLALTQVLVETLTLILFVVVFLPLSRDGVRTARSGLRRSAAAGLSLAVGLVLSLYTVFASAMASSSSRVSEFYINEGVTQGQGRNLVNVILTDFRSLDTLGEIVVIGVAALGVFGLLRGRRRES